MPLRNEAAVSIDDTMRRASDGPAGGQRIIVKALTNNKRRAGTPWFSADSAPGRSLLVLKEDGRAACRVATVIATVLAAVLAGRGARYQ